MPGSGVSCCPANVQSHCRGQRRRARASWCWTTFTCWASAGGSSQQTRPCVPEAGRGDPARVAERLFDAHARGIVRSDQRPCVGFLQVLAGHEHVGDQLWPRCWRVNPATCSSIPMSSTRITNPRSHSRSDRAGRCARRLLWQAVDVAVRTGCYLARSREAIRARVWAPDRAHADAAVFVEALALFVPIHAGARRDDVSVGGPVHCRRQPLPRAFGVEPTPADTAARETVAWALEHYRKQI